MRFFNFLTVAIFAPAVIHAKSKEPWWDNEGDSCYKPEGPYEELCENVTLQSTDENCVLSAQCMDVLDGSRLQSNMTIPKGVLYKNVIVVGDRMEHSTQISGGCLPCFTPQGNFKESCVKSVFEPFAENPSELCIFSTYCDTRMINMSKPNAYLRGDQQYSLNQITYPAGVEYQDMKNYANRLVHPSGELNVTTECYEVGDEPMLPDSSADRFKSDRALVAGVVTASLVLTL